MNDICPYLCSFKSNSGYCGRTGGYDGCQYRKILKNVPPADVRPVVRGKWIADGDGYHWTYNCSICGWKDGYPFNERHNYCPNCGAMMIGVQNG